MSYLRTSQSEPRCPLCQTLGFIPEDTEPIEGVPVTVGVYCWECHEDFYVQMRVVYDCDVKPFPVDNRVHSD